MAKKVPMRMCVGCREMKPKKELLRVVRLADQQVQLDFTGKKSGRGAYVCRDEACMARALKQRQLERALEVNLQETLREQLMQEVRGLKGETADG